MRWTSTVAFALVATAGSCGGVAGDRGVDPCPSSGVREYAVTLETSAPVAELTLARAPRIDFFPAIGPESAWGVDRVDVTLRTAEPLDVVRSAHGELTEDARVIGRVEAGEGAFSITGPTSPGHLLLVRRADPKASPGSRPLLRIDGHVRVRFPGPTCTDLDARLRSSTPRCGNGRLDLGEACDDGNADPGDGCEHCLVSTPRCAPDVEGPAALRPWSCEGEPSTCHVVDCGGSSEGPCREQVQVDIAALVAGRTKADDSSPLHVTGDASCRAEGSGDVACSLAWPVCTPLSLQAVPSQSVTLVGWTGACETKDPACAVAGSPSNVAVIATATTEDSGIAWVSAFPTQVQEVHTAAAAEGFVALALATTIPSVTAPEAGGFVHRRAAQLVVYGPEGRVRFERRVGGRAEHVQPRAVAALGDGGVLLAAAFPDDFPLFAPDAPRRRTTTRDESLRSRMVLRLVRFSAAGDPVWIHELGEDGAVRLGLTDAHAWVAVTRSRDAEGAYSEIFDLGPRGERRWRVNLPGWRVLDLGPDRGELRVVGYGASGALRTVRLDGTGEPTPSTRLRTTPVAPGTLGAGVGGDRIVVANAIVPDGPGYGSIVVQGFDGSGTKLWTREWVSVGVCGKPMVRVDGDSLVAIVQSLCEPDGNPGGFVVDRLDVDGRSLWRQRLAAAGSGGTRPLAVDVDGAGHVVVAGRNDPAAVLGGHLLAEEGAFVVRLWPGDPDTTESPPPVSPAREHDTP